MEHEHTQDKAELERFKTLEKAQDQGDKRYAFKPVEWIVYAMVGSILFAFLAALISRVIPKDSPPATQANFPTTVQ